MFNFSRKDTEFFDLFLENAKFFHLGAVLLDDVIKDPNQALERIEDILGLESAADEVNEKIINKLNLSFITPIDREDILAIAGELANGVDMMQGALQRIIMYHAGHATKRSHALTKLLLDSSNELVKAFKLLNDVKKNQREILDAVHKVSDNESRTAQILEYFLKRRQKRLRNTEPAAPSFTLSSGRIFWKMLKRLSTTRKRLAI